MRHKSDLDFVTAAHVAEKVIQQEGITTLPINVFQIADKQNILVQAKPTDAKGVSGMLVRSGDNFGIMYATHIQSEGFQRFSVAHELGHFFLEGHIEHILSDSDIHQSRAGFLSDDPYERQADHFAAALLMPNPLFSDALIGSPDGLEGIIQLSGLCQTSLTATAIRYSKCTECAAAIIISEGDQISFCFMSENMKGLPDMTWLKKGDPLPKTSKTREFNNNGTPSSNQVDSETNLTDWFNTSKSYPALEEIIHLGSYGKTLTVLTCKIPDDSEDEEENLITRFSRW